MKNEAGNNCSGSRQEWEAPYLGFFEEFNSGRYFEAHEVLEVLWLKVRGTPPANYYKGLIQLAGAFVHLRHERPGPAASLFRLAQNNLMLYQPAYQGLDLPPIIALIQEWLRVLGSSPPSDSLLALGPKPQLPLPDSNLST